jgi:uncharacterized membrane protein YbhN (UPF0104 family)
MPEDVTLETAVRAETDRMFAGLVGAVFAENLFFVVVALGVYLWLSLTVTGSFDVHFRILHEHPVATLLIVACGPLLIVTLMRFFWRRFRTTWQQAKEGRVILTHPRIYVVEVASVQLGSYLARMGVNATLMHAYGIPVSARNIFLIVAASSISSTVAITPGGVGAQTALTSVLLLPEAPRAR